MSTQDEMYIDELLERLEKKDNAIKELTSALKEAANVLDTWQIAEEYNPSDKYKALANKYLGGDNE